MLKVWFVNFGFFSPERFITIADAINYGKSKCFEFSVYEGTTCLATWSPIGGLKYCESRS